MDTIFSSASSSQKSAIKIIRVSGSETKKIPKIFSFKPTQPRVDSLRKIYDLNYNIIDNDRGYDGIKIQILKKVNGEYVNHQIIDGPSGWFDLPPTWIEWIPFIEMFDVNGDGILDIVPDSEGISNPNYNELKRFWGMYYRGDSSGRFELDFFNPNQPN